MRNSAFVLGLGVLAALLYGCPDTDPGGLRSEDFVQVAANGFGELDGKNDYAWSMEYFVPDGQEDAGGYVYVGTGNGVLDMMIHVIRREVMGAEEDPPSVAPEIRRYRPDEGPLSWEVVLDYRDIDEGPVFSAIGFRHMTAYRAKDGVKYLYAATMGQESALWRTATGEPGSWEHAGGLGKRGSIRWMQEHDGLLYLAYALDVAREGETQIGEVWATDGEDFWLVVDDGFGNPNNGAVASLASYKGWLYAGTYNRADGYEIWKLAGPDKQAPPVSVVLNGGPSPDNEGATTPAVFQDSLYYGSAIYFMTQLPNVEGLKGCDIVRIGADDSWETVVGSGAPSGSGFDAFRNMYCWWMTEYDGWLYASTYDITSSFWILGERIPDLVAPATKQTLDGRPFLLSFDGGGDLYKSPDGVHWYPVSLNGFGNPFNYGFRTMISTGNELYVGTANPHDGMEVWLGNR